jgi:hypothetical protein
MIAVLTRLTYAYGTIAGLHLVRAEPQPLSGVFFLRKGHPACLLRLRRNWRIALTNK